MSDQFRVEWEDSGREPQCAPDPAYPNGKDIRLPNGFLPDVAFCTAELPYPARRCGLYVVTCNHCRVRVGVTTASRPDDPKSVQIPCRGTVVKPAPHQSAAAQTVRTQAPLHGNAGTHPASAADHEDSCYDPDEFRPSDYYEIPAAGQEQLATGASLAAPPAQPRGDLTWQEAREKVRAKWLKAYAQQGAVDRVWRIWISYDTSIASAPTEAEAWIEAARRV